jgi:ParB-like chromosome segregation protein Spo0J
LVQPINVRPIDLDRYEVVAGARRFRAAKLANLNELVAHVMDLTDEQVIEVQLIENAQRQDVQLPTRDPGTIAIIQHMETGVVRKNLFHSLPEQHVTPRNVRC